MERMVMETGIVKWFNDAKGFGFVETEKGDEIICDKWDMISEPKTMKERQKISFDREKVDRKDVAKNIEIIEDDSIPPPLLMMNKGKVYCEKPLIIVFEDAIPIKLCEEIIQKHVRDKMNPNSGLQSRKESYAQVTEMVENRGISLGMDPYHYNEIASAIVKNCGIPYSYIEAIDIYNYETGQYLDLHHDYPYDPKQINYYSHGGDRVGTAIFYLNDDYDGGVTSFPQLGVDIHPKAGSILYFKQEYDEATNWSTIHESTLITKGTKWIASCFFGQSDRIGFTDRNDFVPQENPVFEDEFYVKKFMEIQQQNIVLYKSLLKIKNDPELSRIAIEKLGPEVFDILKKCPA